MCGSEKQGSDASSTQAQEQEQISYKYKHTINTEQGVAQDGQNSDSYVNCTLPAVIYLFKASRALVIIGCVQEELLMVNNLNLPQICFSSYSPQ